MPWREAQTTPFCSRWWSYHGTNAVCGCWSECVVVGVGSINSSVTLKMGGWKDKSVSATAYYWPWNKTTFTYINNFLREIYSFTVAGSLLRPGTFAGSRTLSLVLLLLLLVFPLKAYSGWRFVLRLVSFFFFFVYFLCVKRFEITLLRIGILHKIELNHRWKDRKKMFHKRLQRRTVTRMMTTGVQRSVKYCGFFW